MRAPRIVVRRAAVALVAAVVLVGSGAGLARAVSETIPDEGGVIHGCYGESGLLRAVVSSADCRPRETALDWSVSGPQGPAGPQGIEGPAGPAGVSGIYVEFEEGLNGIPGNRVTFTADCEESDVALSGGFDLGLTNSLEVTESQPNVESGAPTGWSVTVFNSDDGELDPEDYPKWDMWAVCAATLSSMPG